MFITILLFTLAAILFHWQWIRKLTYWKRKGFPYVPGTFPFGSSRNLSWFTKFQGEALQDLYQKLEPHPLGGLYIWNQPVLLLRDPDYIRLVMTKEFQHFRDRGRLESKSKQPLMQHLFALDGDLWKSVRVKLTPTFTSGRLKNMFSLFETCALKLEETLKKIVLKDEAIDIKDLMTCFTLDVITSCAFGLESNAAENELFRKSSQRMFVNYVALEKKIKLSLYRIFPFLANIYVPRIIDPRVEKFIMTLVANTIKERETNNVRRNDFLDLMIQLKNKGYLDSENKENGDIEAEYSSLEMTPALVTAQCYAFFGAGFETSSSVQSLALYELAIHQDIQSRLRLEIDEVAKLYDGRITYEAFQKMPYMEQVISEVLRKYPTASILTRKCGKTINLENFTIEKGTEIMIPVYALHYDAKYFPNPEIFNPERFSLKNKTSILPYTYLPFGEGPRRCIGTRFGMIQTKMGLYTVLSKYKILPSKDTSQVLEFGVTTVVTRTKEPIKLVIKIRDDLLVK